MIELQWQGHLKNCIGNLPGIYLERHAIGIVRFLQGSGLSEPTNLGVPDGAADLIGFVFPPLGTGTFLAIECKGEKTAHRQAQKDWGSFVERGGGLYIVCRLDKKLSLEENLNQAKGLVLARCLERMGTWVTQPEERKPLETTQSKTGEEEDDW